MAKKKKVTEKKEINAKVQISIMRLLNVIEKMQRLNTKRWQRIKWKKKIKK